MSTWNYRVVETKHSDTESTFSICEVYYDEAGEITAMSGAVPMSSTDSDYKNDLLWELEQMKLALEKPVIQNDYFDKK